MPDPLSLAAIAADLPPPTLEAEPPPRFFAATFDSYRPGNESQATACHAVRQFASGAAESPRGGWFGRRTRPRGAGLYLDGGYGVGKTHLLAAAFHACPAERKAYLTFQQLVHALGALGADETRQRFAEVALLCVDEFELDDPGNTLIVKRFLEALLSAGGRVITTSNTPPEAQGEGRFNAEDFRREIQGIASSFQSVSLRGPDYRHRHRPASFTPVQTLHRELSSRSGAAPHVSCSFTELLELLRSLHPIRYGALLARVGTLFVHDVEPLAQQADALRFVHFVDQLYDRQVGLRASGGIAPQELFDPSYRNGAYQKKHDRCISRLGELLEEPLSPQLPQTRTAQGFD